MRFFADGPSIPDDLLTARDEGRTLFFCGAGVSRANADLPDFFGLAKTVLTILRALPDSPASKLINVIEEQEQRSGVRGLVSADRLFGLLEREFSTVDIQNAVGEALKPRAGVDLRAHRILLDLSRDMAGEVRIVTTNFDLLFEAAAPKAQVWTPLRLPQFREGEIFDGIVHLHGMFDKDYAKPIGGNLILSSAEFGRAYLAEGWATEFIRKAIKNYRLVFVGYGADDPPVQYLLEALNRSDSAPAGLYAFQSGHPEEAAAQWAHKGVAAIAYSTDNRHAALWETLEAWSRRAADPEKWRRRLIRRAAKGPWALEPHERGQVVHLAMTDEGARSIAQVEPALPATWLCAFDPSIRYTPPSKLDAMKDGSSEIDPFERYGLDSDPRPVRDQQNLRPVATVPEGVLDVLTSTRSDPPTTSGGFRGRQSSHSSELAPRLISLSSWFRRICGEPAAVWWAAGQLGLHPKVIEDVSFTLDHSTQQFAPVIRSAWRYLFGAWESLPNRDYTGFFALKATIARDGWNLPQIRRFAELSRPRLKAERPYWRWHLDGKLPNNRLRSALVILNVRYPQKYELVEVTVPDLQLSRVLPALRHNLELAVDLEHEINPGVSLNIAPIEPDPSLIGQSSDREFGINIIVFQFLDLFRRYIMVDSMGARKELDAWRDDDQVFDRFRIWSTRLPHFLDDATAAKIFDSISRRSFWNARTQRDLLLALRDRWSTVPPESKLRLEKRLLNGPPPIPHTSRASNRRQHAWSVLQTVTWLQNEGCGFQVKLDKRLQRFAAVVPEWRPALAERASDSLEGRGGWVTVDETIDGSDEVPLSNLLAWARAGSGKSWGQLREIDPFAGLAKHRPVRVLAALRHEAASNADVASAWGAFLRSDARRSDKPRVAVLIARRLAAMSLPDLTCILDAACYWVESAHKILYARDWASMALVISRLINAIGLSSDAFGSKTRKRDWVTEALGSAPGHLTDAIFGDPDLQELQPDAPLPEWVTQSGAQLLALPGDHGRFVLAIFSRRLGWLHYHSPGWTEEFVTSALAKDEPTRDAMLAGFFLNPYVYSERLYLILKPTLLTLAARESRSQSYSPEALGIFCLGGWLDNKPDEHRWLSSDEFRRVLVLGSDSFKTHILWHVGRLDYDIKVSFFREVWPLHLAVKTPEVANRLCVLLFDEVDHFIEFANVVLPFVARLDGQSVNLPLFGEKVDRLIAAHPEEVLEILSRTLSGDVTTWPYGADQTLEKIAQANGRLSEDPRMIQLRGIWDTR